MCMGGSSPSYTPPPTPPEPAALADKSVQMARSDEKLRQRKMVGRSSTNKTNGLLADDANTTAGGLLG